MTNPNKVKGSAFERLAVDILNKLVKNSVWKRIPGSGAMGTSLGEPLLTSDIVGKVDSVAKKFKVEAKVGYNSSKVEGVKQFVVKKEWLDKVADEARASYSIPMLVGKFSGALTGTKVFMIMDILVFAELINEITLLTEEVKRLEKATEHFSDAVEDIKEIIEDK